MPLDRRNVAVLGSTGSIGKSTLEVIAAHPDRLAAFGLSTHQKVDDLTAQARTFLPKSVVLSGLTAESLEKATPLPKGCQVSIGPDALEKLASSRGGRYCCRGDSRRGRTKKQSRSRRSR